MDSNEKTGSTTKYLDRIRKSWVPLAAVGGALASFAAAAFRTRPEPREQLKPSGTVHAASGTELPMFAAKPAAALMQKYAQTAVLGAANSPHAFRNSLADVAVGSDDTIYALGDDEVRVFSSDGAFLRGWKVPHATACLEAAPDGRVLTGSAGRIGIYSAAGELLGGFSVGAPKAPAAVTAIKLIGDDILVADAAARMIYRYDSKGNRIGVIGDRLKTGSFMLPNKWLDFDVASDGLLYATDTGRHRVTGWRPDGSPAGSFGKFGMRDPSDFVGCCNPVNIAVTPDKNIVTAEKMIARIKVYDPQGALLAYIGPENFHPECRNIHLAVDSRGRILAADPKQREIRIFAPSVEV
jgi:hypothetical protein